MRRRCLCCLRLPDETDADQGEREEEFDADFEEHGSLSFQYSVGSVQTESPAAAEAMAGKWELVREEVGEVGVFGELVADFPFGGALDERDGLLG